LFEELLKPLRGSAAAILIKEKTMAKSKKSAPPAPAIAHDNVLYERTVESLASYLQARRSGIDELTHKTREDYSDLVYDYINSIWDEAEKLRVRRAGE
jgi:hypothetical protein